MKAPFPDFNLRPFIIVDDCDDDVFLLRRLLREADVTNPIQVFQSGIQAWEFFRATAEMPEFLFVDIKLPGSSGFDLIRRVRSFSQWDAMRVVVVTNSNDPADLNRAIQLGAEGYLVKLPGADLLREFLHEGPWFGDRVEKPRTATAGV